MILIVGGDSGIGGALRDLLAGRGADYAVTSRRLGAELPLDLAKHDATVLPPADIVVLCAAVSSIACCEADLELSWRVNVEASLDLARRYAEHGALVVGLSSSQVLDGNVPRAAQQTKPAPQSAYGRQKLALEQGLLALGAHGAMLRLTKVLTPAAGLFGQWRDALCVGQTIHPYVDMTMSPIELDEVAQVIDHLCVARRSGLFQVSARDDISYAEAARLLCAHMGADPALVVPVPAPKRPAPFTSLATSRAEAELGWQTRDAASTLRAFFDDLAGRSASDKKQQADVA